MPGPGTSLGHKVASVFHLMKFVEEKSAIGWPPAYEFVEKIVFVIAL